MAGLCSRLLVAPSAIGIGIAESPHDTNHRIASFDCQFSSFQCGEAGRQSARAFQPEQQAVFIYDAVQQSPFIPHRTP
jgi:hypothetical protein